LPHSWLRISTGKYSATATILDSKIVGRGAGDCGVDTTGPR
jgi:hypothetical protein